MTFGMGNQTNKGFTIVELLIVVVVIAILAAITIVAYNGIQNRATASAVSAEVAQNAKIIVNSANASSGVFTTPAVMSGGNATLNYSADKYRVVTYCTNGTEFVLAFETKNGKKYYSRSSNVAAVNNDSIDSFQPCASLSVSGAQTTYTNLPTQCAAENTTCTFTGMATVVYGSASQGRFNRLLNQTSPLTCNNTNFGDPAPTFAKACYVYPN